MKKIIILQIFLLVLSPIFGQINETDSVKVTLQINGKSIKKTFRHIDINFKTKKQNQEIKVKNNYIFTFQAIPDSSEILIFYKSEEISGCFKYAPATLSKITALDIKIITSEKKLKKESKKRKETERFGVLKNICLLTATLKGGEQTLCKSEKWLEPLQH